MWHSQAKQTNPKSIFQQQNTKAYGIIDSLLKKKNAVKIAKFIEAEGRMVVTRGWREKLVKVYKV